MQRTFGRLRLSGGVLCIYRRRSGLWGVRTLPWLSIQQAVQINRGRTRLPASGSLAARRSQCVPPLWGMTCADLSCAVPRARAGNVRLYSICPLAAPVRLSSPSMTPAVLRGASEEQHRITAPDLVRTRSTSRAFPASRTRLYTALRSLWLEGNVFLIEGLGASRLQTLFLQQNTIERIGPGLRRLTKLVTLDLSDNGIERVEGLDTLMSLQTLRLARNRLGPSLRLR